MELTKQQLFELNKRYLHSGGTTCPFCDKGTVTPNDPLDSLEGGFAQQKVHCDECEASWWDYYKLVKMDDVVPGTVVP